MNAMLGVSKDEVAVNNLQGGDGELKVGDTAWGFGADVGVLLEPFQGTRFGVTYLSALSLNFEDIPSVSGLAPGLSEIVARFGLLDRPLDPGLTVPQSVMVSAYHDFSERLAILANVGWQDWSQFGKVDVALTSETPTSLTLDLNYKDTWHVAVGGQYRLYPKWLLSTGFAYDSSAVDDKDRTVTLPMGEAYRIGAGAQWQMRETMSVGFAYELVWSGDMPVDQFRGSLAGRVSGDFSNSAMHMFGTNLTWTF